MKINMKKFTSLNSTEMIFLYSMLVSYGEMPELDNTFSKPKKRKNNQKRKKRPTKKRDTTKPDLYNFDDPLWKTCTDEKFLAYREIMERIDN